MPKIESKNAVEALTWRLCAYRLDPSVSATEFVEVLDRLIAAVRKDERARAKSTGDSDASR